MDINQFKQKIKNKTEDLFVTIVDPETKKQTTIGCRYGITCSKEEAFENIQARRDELIIELADKKKTQATQT